MSALKTKYTGTECMRWALNNRARRVPRFVIAYTGCKTKTSLMKKFALGTVFEKEEAPVKVLKPVHVKVVKK